MGVTLCLMRMREDYKRMQEDELKITQNKRLLAKLTKFSSAVGDGNISPAEIAGLDDELFGDAIDFMYNSEAYASENAAAKASEYEETYGQISASDYYQNSELMKQATLYYDDDGNLDMTKIASKIYEEELVEFAQKYLAPAINEMETEIQDENDKLQTEYEQLSAEYDSLKQTKSQEIQRETIQLS